MSEIYSIGVIMNHGGWKSNVKLFDIESDNQRNEGKTHQLTIKFITEGERFDLHFQRYTDGVPTEKDLGVITDISRTDEEEATLIFTVRNVNGFGANRTCTLEVECGNDTKEVELTLV